MTKTITIFAAAVLLACSIFQTGCSKEAKPRSTAKKDVAVVQSTLAKAAESQDPKTAINSLRRAYDQARQLKADWPDAKVVLQFSEQHKGELGRIPGQVYELSLQVRDLDAFKWAISNSAKPDIQYFELQEIWKMGTSWRDHCISVYPEKALPIFMNEAIDSYRIRFFNQYVGAFKASGYRLTFPMEKTEFNARFCRFFAEMITAAMKQQDAERIGFLLDHMPTYESVIFIDPRTKETMKALGDYIFHESRDEAMACKLIALGYDLNRVDVSKAGFGSDFAEALMADLERAVLKTDFSSGNHKELLGDLEHAVTHVLKLNEWHGALSEEEIKFVLILPDPILRSVHILHITAAIEASTKSGNSENTLRLIKLSEKMQPMAPSDYDEFLGWSLKYKNDAVRDYVKTKCTPIDIYRISLADLAERHSLFLLHAPEIMRRVYKTMDRRPREDGTTLGRIDDLMRSHHPEAVLYIVQNYDFGEAWTDATTSGRTLLMAVCEGGNLEAARYLVESKGANVHAQTDYTHAVTSVFGQSKPTEGRLKPILFAAKSGNSELLKYLVSKRANVNSQSGFGATPLMYAVSGNHLEATKTLISLGAFVNTPMNTHNEWDSTAYRRALQNRNTEIQDVLLQAGARPD